jgi:serine/threonine-protein kinase RsbW
MTIHEASRLGTMGKVTLTLPMEQDFELVAIKVAKTLAEMKGLTTDQIDEVRMAVVEACINAFEHSRSPGGTVDVIFEPMEDRLVITVVDHGKGFTFDPNQPVPRITSTGRKRGYGLRIIREMMDEVKLEPSTEGTRIVMIKCCNESTS